jgi:hypothetical protein
MFGKFCNSSKKTPHRGLLLTVYVSAPGFQTTVRENLHLDIQQGLKYAF